MTEEEWIDFLIYAMPQAVSIARIPANLSHVLGCSSRLVQMHHAYAVKSHTKHGLEPHLFPMVGITIDLGRALLDKHGDLQFFYFEEVIFGKWFHVAVKSNEDRTELWVSSFHITKPGEVARHTRRGTILRHFK